jgi:hypothetical protein
VTLLKVTKALCLSKIPCSPWRKPFLQTNGQPCFNLVKRIGGAHLFASTVRTSNFKISNGKDQQQAARVDSRLFQAARRS